MKCEIKDIPRYLHWNDRTIYKSEDFYYFHKLYRLKPSGNPIDIPAAWLTAISCKWSRFIKNKHILLQPENKIGDDYDFVYIKELRNYERKSTLQEEHEYAGVHSLTCILKHSPLICDYSHSEILIRHRVFKENSTKPFFDETYTYKSWENQTALLKKSQAKFFKELKKDFRLDMIRLISRNSSDNNLFTDILSICNFMKWKKLKY